MTFRWPLTPHLWGGYMWSLTLVSFCASAIKIYNRMYIQHPFMFRVKSFYHRQLYRLSNPFVSSWRRHNETSIYLHATSRTFHPAKSWIGLGYIMASPVLFVWPHNNSDPAEDNKYLSTITYLTCVTHYSKRYLRTLATYYWFGTNTMHK